MPSLEPKQTGRTYWRSLNDLADTAEFRRFVEAEFPAHAEEMLDAKSRRSFLKIMGASMALAGLTGCRWPKEKIVPYAARPDGLVPGTPQQFATCMELGGVGMGLLATSYDRRPVKIEGNPSHPDSGGAATALAQAALLELYDPDRSRALTHREEETVKHPSWNAFASFAKTNLAELDGGEGLCFLSEATSSPSVHRLRGKLHEAFPRATWRTYEPISDDNVRAGASLVFGEPVRTQFALGRADVLLSLDADFLLDNPEALSLSRDFAQGRNPAQGTMNRLYVVESTYTTTGSMADHRLPIPSSHIGAFVRALAKSVFLAHGVALPQGCDGLRTFLESEDAGSSHFSTEFMQVLAGDLVAAHGRSAILVGARQPAWVHGLAHVLNAALGNVGRAVAYVDDLQAPQQTSPQAIRDLTADLNAGRVKTLVILGGNPVYDAPADLAFGEALAKAATAIHLSLYENETSRACHWHLPRAHFLESWGDARAHDGTYCTAQPLIEPLHGGKSTIELLSILLDEKPLGGYPLLQETVRSLFAPVEFDSLWERLIHDGVDRPARDRLSPSLRSRALLQALQDARSVPQLSPERLEIVFCRDASVHDGRFANNGWLQELPDFITKITWDNAALIAPATAEALGIENEEVVVLNCGGRKLETVAYLLPGQAENSVAVSLGYGRMAAGNVGDGVGFDLYPLRTSEAMDFDSGLKIDTTGRTYALSCTQDHHAIDAIGMAGRAKRLPTLIRETDMETYRKDPHFVDHIGHKFPDTQMWEPHESEGSKWGMAIDLNACTGCNACVLACQSENNIPIVGKKQVGHGREMHWIRLDRYFTGEPENPEIAHQPVACMHCENAPCEQVCPVAATVHSEEGLNVMVYNRCVGTRYCSNNCPYKVRRFNFFNYHKDLQETEKMGFNPEVTVRSRGVMEKCTYCVQRIEAAKIEAKNENRPLRDGEIVPACQQTCPTRAIVFGDLGRSGDDLGRSERSGQRRSSTPRQQPKLRNA